MYVPEGHFLAPHIAATNEGELCQRLIAVDTDLMVGVRLTGYDHNTGDQIIDLIKVDKVFFVNVPPGLKDLVPEGLEIIETTEEGE